MRRPGRRPSIPARPCRDQPMRPAAILIALCSPLAWPPPGAAAAQEGHDAAARWHCERLAPGLTRCAVDVAAPGGLWEITARVWLRRATTAAPLAGELRIAVDAQPCGPPLGVALPPGPGGLVNHTLLARCGAILAPGRHWIEAAAGFGNSLTGADRVKLRIARAP